MERVILYQAFRLAPLDDPSAPSTGFSPAEERYLARVGNPQGSRTARRLAKDLLREWRAGDLDPAAIEILPTGASADSDAPSGPPWVRLPKDILPTDCRVHLSLSHSRRHAAALLVVEQTQPDAPFTTETQRHGDTEL